MNERRKPNGRRRAWWIAAGCAVLALIAAAALYVSDYYPAAQSVFAQTDGVAVAAIDGGWAVGDTCSDAGLVFYPGGKVEAAAYLPLLKRIAQDGVLCLLADMPLRLAVLDVDAADRLISQFPQVDTWRIGGHSLGGSMACVYAAKHPAQISGVVLLGAYPAADLPMPALLIYGSEDGVMNRAKYAQARERLETYQEKVIEGGNHAYFGDYGEQVGDGQAQITPEAQKAQTAAAIRAWQAAPTHKTARS